MRNYNFLILTFMQSNSSRNYNIFNKIGFKDNVASVQL